METFGRCRGRSGDRATTGVRRFEPADSRPPLAAKRSLDDINLDRLQNLIG